MNLPSDKIISCFYESSTDCVKVIDTHGTLLSFNPQGLDIMEIDRIQDVVGKNWLDMWRGDIAPKVQAAFNKAVQGEPGYFEGYCPTFKGTPKWWQVSIVPLKNEYNEVQWILAVSRDVTEIQMLREEVKDLRQKLDAAVVQA